MYCKKCKVNVRAGDGHCPLCQTRVSDKEIDNIFPKLDYQKEERRYFRVMVLIMLVASVVCVTVNYSMPHTGYWSVLVLAGFFSFGVSFYTLLSKWENVYKTILWEVVILSAIAVMWDVFTGFRGWSTDFVVPITCTAAMGAMAILAQVSRLEIGDYIVYLIIDVVFALISLLLMFIGVTRIALPSLICIGTGVVSLGILIIFEGRALISEIKRRMHL